MTGAETTQQRLRSLREWEVDGNRPGRVPTQAPRRSILQLVLQRPLIDTQKHVVHEYMCEGGPQMMTADLAHLQMRCMPLELAAIQTVEAAEANARVDQNVLKTVLRLSRQTNRAHAFATTRRSHW